MNIPAGVIHGARLIGAGCSHGDAAEGSLGEADARSDADASGWIAWRGERIVAVGNGEGWRTFADEHGAVVSDAGGGILTPGFIDLHGHGGGGAAYDDGLEAIQTARARHLQAGTTRAVISLVTAPIGEMQRNVELIAELSRNDPTILGSHLEGPFLAPERKGAHDGALLREVGAGDALAALLRAGHGTVQQVTLAPELPGGHDAVSRVVAAGAVAAIGHTSATLDQARDAFTEGATLLTHAFNAMPPLHHRDPGPLGAATSDPRVTLEIIADGVHLHPDIIALAFRLAPGRVALVTDAMAAAGADDGEYILGALNVTVAGGVARLPDGTIAGSTLTQDVALRTTVAAGVCLGDAVRALTATPARVIGRDKDLGHLAVGYLADAVLLSSDLQVRAVWCAGQPAP